MEVESTASQSIGGGPDGEPNNYLINTSKAVRGHKLKTRDFIKLQMMRFRRCSPVKYEDLQEKQPLPHCESSPIQRTSPDSGASPKKNPLCASCPLNVRSFPAVPETG